MLIKKEVYATKYFVNIMLQEIVRQPKVFKPLVIPKSLQKALPYRDKPKLVPRLKKKYEPIAVIREPYEQKVKKK